MWKYNVGTYLDTNSISLYPVSCLVIFQNSPFMIHLEELADQLKMIIMIIITKLF